jgi:hypothetical protein
VFRWFLGLFFGKRTEPSKEIPVICKFWQEDGVWNGSAHDLPVAVFGNTLEEAKEHLADAIISHFCALQKIGQLDAVVFELQNVTHHQLNLDDMANNELFCKTTARMSGVECEVLA